MEEQLWSTPFFIFKMVQVTPLFKKDDESNKANYRPVTVLPVLNNIYKRLLAAQLGEFYSAILSDFISSYRKFYSCETALLYQKLILWSFDIIGKRRKKSRELPHCQRLK